MFSFSAVLQQLTSDTPKDTDILLTSLYFLLPFTTSQMIIK